MKSNVFYFTARTHSYRESMSKIKGSLALWKLKIEEKIKKGDKTVIKTLSGFHIRLGMVKMV